MRNRGDSWFTLTAALFLALALAPCLGAQSTSSLNGRITDPSGEAIPGAKITLIQPATGTVRSLTSDAQGLYNFTSMVPGTYQLNVSAPGFATDIEKGVELLVSQPSTVNVALKLASTATTVEVTATAPLVNHTDATIGNAFNQEQIKQLPTANRNVVQLLAQQPGVVFLGLQPGITQSTRDTRSGAVNGIRSDQSNVTLDGVDVNDQLNGYAFTSVLNVPPDSLQQFRLTTSNPGSSAGHSAGAQVAMVTKSGTNDFHGSFYEYNRNTALSANDVFLKTSQIEAKPKPLPNKAAPLIRNVYGFTFGGPFLKNKLFFFTNYEGRQDRESQVETRTVPTDSMRAGNVVYKASDGTIATLTPADIQALGVFNKIPAAVAGVDPNMLKYLSLYPEPNSTAVGDGLNTAGFVFASPIPAGYDTYIARVDYHLSPSETLFARGETENFKIDGPEQFPGQPPNQTTFNDSRGIIFGLTSIFSPALVNNLHYGYIRQGGANIGPSTAPEVSTRNLSQPDGVGNYSNNWIIPDNNIIDDLTWNRGNHTFEFGTDIDLSHSKQLGTGNSYSSASLNGSWTKYAGFANVGASPYYPQSDGFKGVQKGFFNDYDYAMIDLLGAVTEYDGTFNYTKAGATLPQGTPIFRNFAVNNYGLFAQDQWHLTPNLVLTSGLRWSYQQPPNEANGNQVYPCVALSSGSCSSEDLQTWFQNTGALARVGLPASDAGQVAFELGGANNNGPAMWKSEWNDLAPRIGIAWSPSFGTGWLSKIFGAPGQFSIRGGYDLLYEHFGNAIVNTFSSNGAIGLTSQISSAEGITVAAAPRFVCNTCLPAAMPPGYTVSAPPGGFPQVPANTFGNIAWGMDSSLRTPFVHELDFSVTRQFRNNQSLSLSYIGTFGRYLPMQEDLAQPADLVDPVSHQDYFSAAQQLDNYALAGTPTANVPNIPFWQHFFPGWNGLTASQVGSAVGACADNPSGPLTATQAMYQWYSCNVGDDTTALFLIDIPGAGLPAPSTGYYSFVHAQYGSLYAWNNIGTSNYNALQATYKTHFGNNLQATLNYTWSHALDEASNAERSDAFSGTGAIVNAWDPLALYANADFNMAQQLNANWVWQLPFGRNQAFAPNAGGLLDALIGGWRLSGDFLTTSGLPGNVSDGQQWSTDWQLSGNGVMTGPIPGMQTTYSTQGKQGRGPNLFANPSAAFNDFSANLPGQSGTRNSIIGNGNFGIDTGLEKAFSLGESKSLGIGWEAFNLTNTIRYNVASASLRLDRSQTFGNYTSTLTQPRFMQIYARFTF